MGTEWYAVNIDRREVYHLHKVNWLDYGLLDVDDFFAEPPDEGCRHPHIHTWLGHLLQHRWKGERVYLVNDCAWSYGDHGDTFDGVYVPPLWDLEEEGSGWAMFSDWVGGDRPLLRDSPEWPHILILEATAKDC